MTTKLGILCYDNELLSLRSRRRHSVCEIVWKRLLSACCYSPAYYAVRIPNGLFPRNPATQQRFTPEAFFNHVRLYINEQTATSSFTPYSAAVASATGATTGGDDVARWTSSDPRGSLLSINLAPFPAFLGRGSVVTSDYVKTPDEYHWIFTTMFTPYDLSHPVSGSRQFGLKRDGNDWVFYITAADRAADLQSAINGNR